MNDTVIDLTGQPATASGDAPAPDDPDALRSLRDRVVAVPGVVAVGTGGIGDLTTFLPGQRLNGVRVEGEVLQLSIVAALDATLVDLAESVRQAASWPGRVDVHIADIRVDEPAEPEEPEEPGEAAQAVPDQADDRSRSGEPAVGARTPVAAGSQQRAEPNPPRAPMAVDMDPVPPAPPMAVATTSDAPTAHVDRDVLAVGTDTSPAPAATDLQTVGPQDVPPPVDGAGGSFASTVPVDDVPEATADPLAPHPVEGSAPHHSSFTPTVPLEEPTDG
jgi:hypothetical protein